VQALRRQAEGDRAWLGQQLGELLRVVQESARQNQELSDRFADVGEDLNRAGDALADHLARKVRGLEAEAEEVHGRLLAYREELEATRRRLYEVREQARAAGAAGGPAREEAAGRKQLGVTVDPRAVVVDVLPDTPAAQAGVRPGDVIVAVNEKAIREGTELPREVARAQPGEEILIEVARGEATEALKARLPEEEPGGGRRQPAG
jgi:hypothetical protein